MDNLTHTLTGAIAARSSPSTPLSPTDQKRLDRTMFWLFLVTVNLPDIDAAAAFFGDSLFSFKHHRGITHSLLFAPFFSLLPAFVASRITSILPFGKLWRVSLIGILLHIFFDVITSFGTQLLAPFSDTRYALDWMFIVDPFFTISLLLLLLFGKWVPKLKRTLTVTALILITLYLSAEGISHTVAMRTLGRSARSNIEGVRTIAALPQPLSIFRWVGLVETSEGVHRTYFSVLSGDSIRFEFLPHATDPLVDTALSLKEARWYRDFARFPLVSHIRRNHKQIIEIQDLQFSVDPSLFSFFDVKNRRFPFILEIEYSPEGNLISVRFNDKTLSP